MLGGGRDLVEDPEKGVAFSSSLPSRQKRRPASPPQHSEVTVKQSYTDSWFAEQGFLETLKGRNKSLVN